MANPDPAEQNALIAQFTAIVGTSSRQAHQFLAANDWELEAAVSNYYAAQEDHTETMPTNQTMSMKRIQTPRIKLNPNLHILHLARVGD
ncbi:hypothetical protein PHISCL_11068 [Aspergillus sclerotialis]|uniref:Uncharacterized protein n=1 Tax=Aspergillus sclerotialis TaxID=2070753 RepID=A0A3A2ZF56_9EURO|nr:hypothetical protein PHISCL_11068 [Aspergillus sclerotialis]